MAPDPDVRSEEKRSEEKKRKEKARYWLHAHGAGNEREKEEYFHKGSTPYTHTKKEIISGIFFNMFGVLLASLSNETRDVEKHHRKTPQWTPTGNKTHLGI